MKRKTLYLVFGILLLLGGLFGVLLTIASAVTPDLGTGIAIFFGVCSGGFPAAPVLPLYPYLPGGRPAPVRAFRRRSPIGAAGEPVLPGVWKSDRENPRAGVLAVPALREHPVARRGQTRGTPLRRRPRARQNGSRPRQPPAHDFVNPLDELPVRLAPLRRQRDPLMALRRVRERDEPLPQQPREIPTEHVVVHVRRDLKAGFHHRSILPPQPFEETGDDVEVRPFRGLGVRHRLTGPRGRIPSGCESRRTARSTRRPGVRRPPAAVGPTTATRGTRRRRTGGSPRSRPRRRPGRTRAGTRP